MAKNVAVIAAAGSRKTQHVVESAIGLANGRILILTYTNRNQREIESRFAGQVGCVPPNILVMGWFSFLIQHCAKPYQRALTGKPLVIAGLNFHGRKNMFTHKTNVDYFLDKFGGMYRDGVSDFVVELNRKTGGAVIARLEQVFDHIFIDEVQDLVGYDLDLLDLLLASRIKLTMVGDPRQQILETNLGPRNPQCRGAGLWKWFEQRQSICELTLWGRNFRSNQAICDFSDAIFPDLPRTTSEGVPTSGHDGVFQVEAAHLHEYVARYGPVTVLRHDKRADSFGLPALNIGVAKGCTFDRVIVIPTAPMLKYLQDGDVAKLNAPERLYVAVSRARHSVTFVVKRFIPGAESRASPYLGVSSTKHTTDLAVGSEFELQ